MVQTWPVYVGHHMLLGFVHTTAFCQAQHVALVVRSEELRQPGCIVHEQPSCFSYLNSSDMQVLTTREGVKVTSTDR